jgi:hypothetical protein
VLSPIKLTLFYIRNYDKIKDGTFSTKYSILHESLKTDQLEILLLSVIIIIIRRIIFGVSVILLHSSPYIQIMLNSIASYAIFIFTLYFKHYKINFDSIMNLYIELNTFLILSAVGAFIYEDLPTYLYDMMEWTLVVLIYMSIMVPALLNIAALIYRIILKCRRTPNSIVGDAMTDIQKDQ